MKKKFSLSQILGIEHSILLAPMFLVSNSKMVIAALQCGCTAAIPALNYRTNKELREAIVKIRHASSKPFGVNLIVNKSNPKLASQLKTLIELKVDFIITSLGNPKDVIVACKPLGIKVFCDVIDVVYAKKVEELGADAIIAVNSQAGGHCGNLSAKELMHQLIQSISLPIIAAGGVTSKKDVTQMMEWGAAGVAVGTIFIATHESDVSQEYKQAMIQYNSKDIVTSTKLTGSPLTVINTKYVQKIGTKANFWEYLINHSSILKKYAKLILAWQGMSKIKKAAFRVSYKNVWCAGPSIKAVQRERSVQEVMKELL
ncbi:2-nitropropane dioxygenase [Labilibaculum filiforme]|uniref:2-nitropropane dioxygenase n=1 Tax=Labilibaculum filiforme TaxID=1940526 RepID=A0A2N3I0B1_9BACT|nr:nitronate monooxygenase [Labilibaculum filiforme]PKQ63759.1 2-nitropropane dioxygenase [Labilibaculum filiforme]